MEKVRLESSNGGNEGRPEPSDSADDNQDWEVDDPDEDIVYVK